MIQSAIKLSLFVLIGIGLLLASKLLTKNEIAKAERATVLANFEQVLPKKLYNNNPLKDTLQVTRPQLLGSKQPVTIYRARKNGQPVGVIFETIAPDGYSGNIYILVGVLANQHIAGVRVLSHRETPGLGDKIEIKKTNWITHFSGKFLQSENDPRWHVKKDGGQFDQFTGATITPRAVVKAVKKALIFVKREGNKIYE